MNKGYRNIYFRYFNRVTIYIDNSNLLNNLKERDGNLAKGGRKIDYYRLCKFIITKLGEYLGNNRLRMTKVKLYDGLASNNDEKKLKKQRFLSAVKERIIEGFDDPFLIVEFGVVEVEVGKMHHLKGDDTLLAVDIVTDLTRRIGDFVVIVSGDADFHSVIRIIKSKFHVPAIVAFFKDSCSHQLREIADIFIPLTMDDIQSD